MQSSLSDVDDVQCGSLDLQGLIGACSTPCLAPRLLRGALKHFAWPALRWGDDASQHAKGNGLARLREQHGHRKVKVRLASRRNANRTPWEGEGLQLEVPLGEFCTWLCGGDQLANSSSALIEFDKDEWSGYCAYQHFEDLFADLPDANFGAADFSQLFGADISTSCGSGPTLWLGSAGARTPCHQDAYGTNVVAQVAGEKRWLLFPPSASAVLKPQRLPYEDASTFAAIDPLSGELPNECGGLVALLRPDDVLLVPHHWWHAVECVSPWSLSVNQWLEAPADATEKVSEALVRCLVTPLLPLPNDDGIMDEGKSWWLNPGEELYDTEDNLDHLSSALAGVDGLHVQWPRAVVRESLIRVATHPDIIAAMSKLLHKDLARLGLPLREDHCRNNIGKRQKRSRSRSRKAACDHSASL